MTDSTKQGWVRFYRKSVDSTVWANPIVWFVWSWMLLKATHTDYKFPFNGEDILIKKGQFIMGAKTALSQLSTLTPQKLRTAIKYLKSTGRITVKTNNKFSIITILKWEDYQCSNSQTNKRLTNEQQTNNKPLTTYKNIKNEKNIKNKEEKEVFLKEDLINKTMYEYVNINEDGSLPKKRRLPQVDEKTNKLAIAIGALWINSVSNKLNIEETEIPYKNLTIVIRRLMEREKHNWKYDDFKKLFNYFLNDKFKDEDKISFDLCMSEKYVAKYKLAQKKKPNTNASISSEIIL